MNPRLREAAGTLGASGGQRQRKRLIANESNRSERAEQIKEKSESFDKSAKLYRNSYGKAESRECRQNLK